MTTKSNIYKTAAVVLLLSLAACSSSARKKKSVIIAADSDVETFNPLFANRVIEGDVSELLFMSLIRTHWNAEKSELEAEPFLAEKIEFINDGNSAKVKIRKDAKWTDGSPVTSEDIIFSFAAASSSKIQSKYFGAFDKYFLNKDNEIDTSKTFSAAGEKNLIINFLPGSRPSLLDIDLPIIPSKILSGVKPEDFLSNEFNFSPVSNGPYKLKSWNRKQSIILIKDVSHFLIHDESPEKIIFKIAPDYSSRLNQLISGEVDFVSDVKPEDAERLKNNPKIKIGKIEGRHYDYIGWNNISPEKYSEGIIAPNRFFGDRRVRRALTFAINRDEIISEFLGSFGRLCSSPIPPLINSGSDKNSKSYFNPDSAKKLLTSSGWIDIDNDGVREKDGKEFSFVLHIMAGNPLRNNAAGLIKNYLKAVGVKAEISVEEAGAFIDALYDKKYNSWLIGWYIQLPLSLNNFWNSDLQNYPNNFASFQNIAIDSLMIKLERVDGGAERNKILSELENKFIEFQPVTFLYWDDEIVLYNRSIGNITIDPLGDFQNCWNWNISE